MTSEIDAIKTTELIRRRKLRLQQVREQSKRIAKKIRQRAEVEKLKEVDELVAKKQQDYFHQQEQLVKKLEEFHAKGIENIGASHKNAFDLNEQEKQAVQIDPSKKRGREAAAQLRKIRQEKLDEQKKILDRKLQAREAGNEASREKSASVAQKLSKTSIKSLQSQSSAITSEEINKHVNTETTCTEERCRDMATQWDSEPNEWEPNDPGLSLPLDDKDSAKETNNNIESKSDKNKRLDVFALSDDMPSSLRGGRSPRDDTQIPLKSLTLVSEYLQTRNLRLRELQKYSKKKNTEELDGIKQTILRTRAAKPAKDIVAKTSKSSAGTSSGAKKSYVSMYDGSTRNVRDIPVGDEILVVRDIPRDDDEDAYSLAMKETFSSPQKKNLMEAVKNRSKVAMNKKDVEKEYMETMTFLKKLPKNNGDRPIRRAFMDEDRQQSIKESRQQKLQQEYKKVLKECKKPNCRNRTKITSPSSNNFVNSDFKYSWMPVPDKEGSLAVHTIPTSLVEGKTGSNVKFSQVDTYHEYRSRHKHTPPTKDTSQKPKQFTQPDSSQNNSEADFESTSETSASEVISLKMRGKKKESKKKDKEELSDAEKIIIYKILDSKNEKTKRTKMMKNIAKSLTVLNQKNKSSSHPDEGISFEELKEGVYEAVNEHGTGDNISSMYFSKDENNEVEVEVAQDEIKSEGPCACCIKKISPGRRQHGTTAPCQKWDKRDVTQKVRPCSGKSPSSVTKGAPPRSAQIIPVAPTQPSVITSTSSFKTASTAKAIPGGFIKVIDDGGEEAGKLFVGASDILGNDAYEVVIQLRKKGDAKENRKSPSNVGKVNKEQRQNNLPVSVETIETSENARVQTDTNNTDAVENSNSSDTANGVNNVDFMSNYAVNTVVVSSPSSTSSVNVKKTEKGVGTTIQTSFTDVSLHNNESKPKPVTTACTQTSWSSPEQRPVLLHLSSTTSTAYMSPPEMILPKFLKQDYKTPDEGIYVRRNCKKKDQDSVSDIEYSEEYECSCNKCVHAKKIVCKTSSHRCKKTTGKVNQATTPPNTARNKLDHLKPYLLDKYNSKKCSCRKCRRSNRNEPASSSKIYSNKHTVMPKSYSSTSYKKERKRKFKSNLNPIIREYVKKLLTMNKVSQKAIQVIEQECSNVTTPGSSIVNISSNNDSTTKGIENKLSLEIIKSIVAEQILKEIETKSQPCSKYSNDCSRKDYSTKNAKLPKIVRKKSVHKVKSLNISKNLLKSKNLSGFKEPQFKTTSSSSSNKDTHVKVPPLHIDRVRSKSSPTPRSASASSGILGKTNAHVANNSSVKPNICTKNTSNLNDCLTSQSKSNKPFEESKGVETSQTFCSVKATSTSKPEIPGLCDTGTSYNMNPLNLRTPSDISTQTSVNSEINLKFDTEKIQAMEKIADLTDKCTKRLSSLAKVLEEVRRSKSMAYSQISTSDDSEHNIPAAPIRPFNDLQKSTNPTPESVVSELELKDQGSDPFVPLLADIPKPDSCNIPTLDLNMSIDYLNKSDSSSQANEYNDHIKVRGKPPPALSRIHLKHVQDNLIPHELSTVVEVDSPMSLKLKSQTSRNDAPESSNQIDNANYNVDRQSDERDPDIQTSQVDLPANFGISHFAVNTGSPAESKIQMIDMNQFNEIMLKPFYSLQEYARNNNIGSVLEDGSNLEDFVKGDIINDEMSSLHSDASLPDVISELLKRNIISEPFKFDTGSNVNSTTVSSESTMSVLALSKMRTKEKKPSVMFENKVNVAETSDTMSISSNPDLENAFKKLGMGWASSTLKKTKERLALSSSSNTSSSSLAQFKTKSFNQEIPTLPTVTDTVSSAFKLSSILHSKGNVTDIPKHAEQQTSAMNSIFTVKEFLNNELAKKITFNNKSRNVTEEEFVSLFETKIPEDMKQASRVVREDSMDNSLRSNNNRARTSTPVQLFKSMTFQSNSSSNLSNGLFSNADDLSSVKHTSNSMKNHSTSEKDDLTIPNFSLRVNKNGFSD